MGSHQQKGDGQGISEQSGGCHGGGGGGSSCHGGGGGGSCHSSGGGGSIGYQTQGSSCHSGGSSSGGGAIYQTHISSSSFGGGGGSSGHQSQGSIGSGSGGGGGSGHQGQEPICIIGGGGSGGGGGGGGYSHQSQGPICIGGGSMGGGGGGGSGHQGQGSICIIGGEQGRIFQCLRGRCSRRNRGYNNNIPSQYGGCQGCSSSIEGRGSFFFGGDGSVTCSREASLCPAMPASSTCSVAAGYSCGGDGAVIISSGDSRGTSGWSTAGGTVPAYSTRRGAEYGIEDAGRRMLGSSRVGGGSSCYTGNLGISAGRGSSYGGDACHREKALTAGGSSGGAGFSSGASGYGSGEFSSPELSPGGAGSSQAMQQKCPVVIPDIETQQSKKSCHWPSSQKK
ncbi:loricrin-like [Oxyura jamaicensis]|uniref:loricrin-like n=1 Tax=Oxyura jamaicensis TaxID=8884 RepID=UPI0015A53F8E|nr:loricrin-like [Oxyura jamaicensis]